nr:MAG TPA: hypothetical protein [Caudoviricetes sp.]
MYEDQTYTEKELYNRLISICGDDNFSVNPDYKNYFLEIITHLGIEGAFDTISSILQDMIPCNLVLDLKNTLEEGNTTPFSVAVPAVRVSSTLRVDFISALHLRQDLQLLEPFTIITVSYRIRSISQRLRAVFMIQMLKSILQRMSR